MTEATGAADTAATTTDTGATGATTAGAGAGVAAVTAAPAAQWFDSLDQDSRGWLDNKQYFGPDLAKADISQGITAMIKAHRGMESIMGRNRIPVPKDAADDEGWTAYYSAGGRPGSWEAYGFKAPEGGDQKAADGYAQIAHKHGLATKQMQGVAADMAALATQIKEAERATAEQTFISTSKADLEGLTREWAGEADHRFAAAQRAGKHFGLDKEKMDKIERALGTRDFLTFLSDVGGAISEDTGAAGAGAGGGVNTVAGARARMAEMKADKVWMDRYLAGGAEEVKEWARMEQILANSMAA